MLFQRGHMLCCTPTWTHAPSLPCASTQHISGCGCCTGIPVAQALPLTVSISGSQALASTTLLCSPEAGFLRFHIGMRPCDISCLSPTWCPYSSFLQLTCDVSKTASFSRLKSTVCVGISHFFLIFCLFSFYLKNKGTGKHRMIFHPLAHALKAPQ